MLDWLAAQEGSMGQNDQYEVYLRRSMECEALAASASDISIREKCTELAVAYRALAAEMQLSQKRGEPLSETSDPRLA